MLKGESMAKKQSLGKGLDLIFDDNTVDSGNSVTYIAISSISPKKNQPRKYFDMESLSDLASSISAHGILQPIIARDLKNGSYEIIAGERRWRAAKLAGLSEVPCIIMDADEILAAEVALVENVQREDLNAYEEATAYRSLMDDFGLSQEEVSKMVGKSRPAVANSLRLLELPKEVLELLTKNELSAGHCRTLLGLRDRNEIYPLALKIAKKNLSVRETEALVKKINKESVSDDGGKVPEKPLVDYRAELERRAMELSGRRIKIYSTPSKRAVQIEYTSDEDLENILSTVCGRSIIEE